MSRAALILALAAGAVGVLAAAVAVTTWGWAFVAVVAGAGVLGGAAVTGVRVARLRARYRRGRPASRPAARAGRSRPGPAIRSAPAGPVAPRTPLARLLELSPNQFEEFTRLLFEASGLYHEVRRVGGSGDGGMDVVMRDGAGNLCVVQCKRYKGTVPAGQIRDLAGVMLLQRSREAFFVTTGRVSHPAQAALGAHKIHVWDGERLVRYAQQYLGDRFEETIERARG